MNVIKNVVNSEFKTTPTPENPIMTERDVDTKIAARPVAAKAIAFAHNSTFPIVLREMVVGDILMGVIVDIQVLFDAGDFSIGFDGAQEAIVTLAQFAPGAVAKTKYDIGHEEATGRTLKLYKTGSPTAGSGKIFIH